MLSRLRKAEERLAKQQLNSLNAYIKPPKTIDAGLNKLRGHRDELDKRITPELHLQEKPSVSSSYEHRIDGQVIAIKDNVCSSEEPTTCASGILKDFRSPYPATVVTKLRAARASFTSKTNLDEFGMGCAFD